MPKLDVRSTTRRTIAVLPLVLLAACGGTGPAPGAPAPEAPRGVPGFDTAIYPGDAAMRTWRAASPYRWVGYYLPAPCHRDASWVGTRARLAAMGWGTAVIYVGQQAWEGVPDRAPGDPSAAARPIICSRTLLTAAAGRGDADDAIAKAAADGFPTGTIVYLDIEPVTTVSDSLRAYYRAWTRRMLDEGRYRPGLYAHRRNVAEIQADMRAEYTDAGGMMASVSVPIWIAAPAEDFSLVRAPTEVGVVAAKIWQGRLTFDETWGGTSLRIDANVADSPSPSAPSGLQDRP